MGKARWENGRGGYIDGFAYPLDGVGVGIGGYRPR